MTRSLQWQKNNVHCAMQIGTCLYLNWSKREWPLKPISRYRSPTHRTAPCPALRSDSGLTDPRWPRTEVGRLGRRPKETRNATARLRSATRARSATRKNLRPDCPIRSPRRPRRRGLREVRNFLFEVFLRLLEVSRPAARPTLAGGVRRTAAGCSPFSAWWPTTTPPTSQKRQKKDIFHWF